MQHVQGLFSIGELSRRSGVPVKTIRFYSDAGLLPPTAVTASRYRLYGEDAWVRLDLVRALRALGFDLATIGQLVVRRRTVAEAARLQIQAARARKLQVQDVTTRQSACQHLQERFRVRVDMHLQAGRAKEPCGRMARRVVVFDEVDGAAETWRTH